MKGLSYIGVFFVLLSASACKEVADAYLGVPLQPQLGEDNFEPGLNIIGVLRPDFSDTISNSFVHVQVVAPAINNYPEFSIDSLVVRDADVQIRDENGNLFVFSYTDHDSLFYDVQYRPHGEFSAYAGSTYTIICNYDDLPELISETLVPYAPSLLEETIVLENNKLSFEILPDSSSFMYEIYVFSEEESIGYHRLIPDNTQSNLVTVDLNNSTAKVLVVYAYDYNLSTYYATSNTSFNFNKYRKPFGDIEGGYGVFGSLNYTVYAFD